MSQNENGNSVAISNKIGSGLTISAVPIKREADNNENGSNWDHDMGNGSESAYDEDGRNQDEYTDSVSHIIFIHTMISHLQKEVHNIDSALFSKVKKLKIWRFRWTPSC